MSNKPTGRPAGRPSKLTEEAIAKIVQLLNAGNFMHVAAAGAGVDRTTFFGWMTLGKQQRRGKYRDFFNRIREALTNAEVINVARIVKAGEKDPKHAKWWLAHGPARRRWADNLSQGKIELTGKGGGPVQIQDARAALEAKLSALAAKKGKKP